MAKYGIIKLFFISFVFGFRNIIQIHFESCLPVWESAFIKYSWILPMMLFSIVALPSLWTRLMWELMFYLLWHTSLAPPAVTTEADLAQISPITTIHLKRGGFNMMTEQRSGLSESSWGIFINNQEGCRWWVAHFVALIVCRSTLLRPGEVCSALGDLKRTEWLKTNTHWSCDVRHGNPTTQLSI